MPTISEVCRVAITWLEPGEVATKSMLCLEHPYPRTVIPYYPTYTEEEDEGEEFTKPLDETPECKPPIWRLDMESFLHALHDYPNYEGKSTYHLDDYYMASDPPVEMLVPVVLFDFDLPSTRESWLSYLVSSDGLEGVFKDDLKALQNIGWYLWRKGQATDYDRFGVTVTFHGLWTIQIGGGEDPDVDWWFSGYVNPSVIEAAPVPEQQKPERRSTTAHRMLLEL